MLFKLKKTKLQQNLFRKQKLLCQKFFNILKVDFILFATIFVYL